MVCEIPPEGGGAEPYLASDLICFGANIRKIGLSLQIPVLLYKMGYKGGKYYTDMFPDDKLQTAQRTLCCTQHQGKFHNTHCRPTLCRTLHQEKMYTTPRTL